MENFDKRMALEAIEDALTDIATPHARGVAIGLCGAFYMCGLLSAEEWEAFLKRIPAEPCTAGHAETRWNMGAETRAHGQLLN